MKLQGSLACLLLVLCLGSGEAGPLLSGGESAGAGAMEATGHGVGEAIGQEVGEAIKHGVGEATGGGDGEAVGSGVKEATGPGVGDDLAHGVEDAAHALGNTGSEADRQAENVIQHGVDAAHSSWQGTPGGNGALGAHGQPPPGGHGTSGSPGNAGGPGIPWDHVYSGGSGGSFGTNSQGGSRGHGGAFNVGTNTQAAVAQTPYGSGRGSDKPNAEGSSNGGSISGGSSNSSSGGSSGGSSGLHWNSQTSPGLFNFDAFWMNLKSMLGFINWDAISKGQVSKPSTRILLYFRRLWENFKRNTPFLNWKAILEPGTGCQDVEAVTSKWGVTISSSASRVRPDLLQWVKFW
ncbi:dermokine isoform X2 [Balaenoptera acutorostrata]|uniref:Dermokine isoform X2 n=1 Tax=Balaenoptera acutorostrata TaxID=9767 RepID=A0ABM3SHP4_BALAC|nr:dermokine isoform X2 [Balaenoptera acutorostrata]